MLASMIAAVVSLGFIFGITRYGEAELHRVRETCRVNRRGGFR